MHLDPIFTKEEKPRTVFKSNGLPLGEETEEDVIQKDRFPWML